MTQYLQPQVYASAESSPVKISSNLLKVYESKFSPDQNGVQKSLTEEFDRIQPIITQNPTHGKICI